VTAPSIEAYRTALNVCRKGGKICVFAPTTPGSSLQVSPNELFFTEIKIIPSYSTSHLETRTALELIASGKLNVKTLITHRFKLTEAPEAFKTAIESKDCLKVVIHNE
jgi:L-iditol 2-dehydrogenase